MRAEWKPFRQFGASHNVKTLSPHEGDAMRKIFIGFIIGSIAFYAYTMGAKAGRGRYREIRATAEALWNDPRVKKARREAAKSSAKTAKTARKKIHKKTGW
jgi:hypothetical protein